jgi:hypothetical protein
LLGLNPLLGACKCEIDRRKKAKKYWILQLTYWAGHEKRLPNKAHRVKNSCR